MSITNQSAVSPHHESAFYTITKAVIMLLTAEQKNLAGQAVFTGMLARKLASVYKDANQALGDIATKIENLNTGGDDSDKQREASLKMQKLQSKYNVKSQEFQNKENVLNTTTQSAQGQTQQIAHNQQMTSQFLADALQTLNYGANLSASAMG